MDITLRPDTLLTYKEGILKDMNMDGFQHITEQWKTKGHPNKLYLTATSIVLQELLDLIVIQNIFWPM